MIKSARVLVFAALALSVSACSFSTSVFWDDLLSQKTLVKVTPPNVNVRDVRVSVPDSLTVSERNVYHPASDIVWHGDDFGDRHEQVRAIFDDAMTRSVAQLHGRRAVYVDVEVTRFHALTPRARYTTGGVHSIKFILTVKDAVSGETIVGPRDVKADLLAFGGRRALEAEHRGETQKVRIKAHLANLILKLLVEPETKAALDN